MPLSKEIARGVKRKANDITNALSDRANELRPTLKPPRQKREDGIVDREFYPPEMSNERCEMYKANQIERPIETLALAQKEIKAQRDKIPVKDAVVHWFKCDLRITDNKALHLASEKAATKGVPLIGLHILSPQDYKAHCTSAVRVDFVLRTLEVLKEDLAELNIPLHVETVEKRRNVPHRILELCQEWGASHLFANMEYEVDELRREALLTRKGVGKGVAVEVVHDTCVVAPGQLASGTGGQYAVYSPWFRAWLAYLNTHPHQLHLFGPPGKNPDRAREAFRGLFRSTIPDAPENKRLTTEEKKRFGSMWPCGEHEARERLKKFIVEKIHGYGDNRNFPGADSTAVLSVHFASGTLSARTAVAAARDVSGMKKLGGEKGGVAGWISEVAWRDFYKHVLAHWPYICMNKPFKPESTDIEWEYDRDLFEKWCRGMTGYPFIDAAMRQLHYTAYMHNRARMAVASFLAKDLLIDWRLGERYFMEHLIDGDFASNNGGWGFSASTGVDPQPYFRIFNPILQSEKFDPDGLYIRRWVPELAQVQGKAIHDPYGKGAKGVQNYPRMCVEHKTAREKALARYKEGLKRDTA
ncbi:MAG: hypothetical protein Q9163_003530 [Psora crenata]